MAKINCAVTDCQYCEAGTCTNADRLNSCAADTVCTDYASCDSYVTRKV